MLKSKVQKVGVLILFSIFLQGCILTDEFKESLIEENKKSQQAQKLELLEIRVNELMEFKPQLKRVIQLEQDLAFVADSLKTMREPSQASYLSGTPELGLQRSLAAVVDKKKQHNLAITKENQLPPELQKIVGKKLLAEPEVTTSAVELSSAPPLIEARSALPTTNRIIDAKFSSLPRNNNSQSTKMESVALKSIPEVVPNKFSSDIPKVNALLKEDCKLASPPNGVFSIHLASYSNLQNAKEGWEQLSKKYLDTLCGLKPVLANVNVAGKEFLSLRVGPFASARDAGRLCDAIRTRGDYCAQAKYEGRSL